MSEKKVLFTASELTPLAKVGGLADVIGALPKALKQLDVDVRIIIPKYGVIDEKEYPMKKIASDISVPFNGETKSINVFETPLPGSDVPIYLIDNMEYLGQNGIYFESDASSSGSSNEAERYSFFARSLMEIFEPLGWYPDIIHCHDWHVGFIPVILEILSKDNEKLQHIKSLLTIHNLEYQGRYDTETIFKAFGITKDSHPSLSELHNGQINSLQQAILNSDHLNTVSPTYAEEIITPEFSAGLEKSLIKRKSDLVGILNGIDVDRFNPETDPLITANYSVNNLDGKAKCKADLQAQFGLEVKSDVPLFGIVTRLADQKGIDLIGEIADKLAQENMQFVLLGTGDPKLETLMKKFAERHQDKVQCKIEFNATIAQQIYAGSDIFLMPSRFEPCGLGQMIAMRYGTVPIVRATGGLKDTVSNVDPKTGKGDGFVFTNFDSAEFLDALKRALALYSKQEKWYTIITHIMQRDFSWNHSAQEYIKLYKQLL